MLGHQLDDKMLKEIIDEVDDDGSGELEFAEFVTLAARFLVEEDAEVSLKFKLILWLKKSFEGMLKNFIFTGPGRVGGSGGP